MPASPVDIVFKTFGPSMPSVSPRLLPEGMSSACVNLDPSRGSAYPMRGLAVVQGELPDGVWRYVMPVKSAQTGRVVYFGRNSLLDTVMRSPLANDTRDRVYRFVSGDRPSVASFDNAADGNWIPLAVVRPDEPPVATASAGSDNDLRETRSYVYTCVTEWGEESAPSPPVVVDLALSSSVTVSGFALPQNTSGREITAFRLYRTLVSGTGVTFRRVADLPIVGGSLPSEFVDTTTELELSRREFLEFSYDEPPDGLSGVRVHPSGALVGFVGRNVHFSVPYMPHAWPNDFVVSVPDRIMALEVWQQYVLVATESVFAVIYGDVPPDLGVLVFPFPVPAAFPGSMILTGSGPVMAAKDGLYALSPNGIQAFSAAVVPPDVWPKLFGGITGLFEYQGRVGVIDDEGRGALFSQRDVVWIDIGKDAPHVFRDPYDARCKVWSRNELSVLGASDDYLMMMWRSPVVALATDVQVEAMRVLFTAPGPVRIKVYANARQLCDTVVKSSEVLPLPEHPPARIWQFEIESRSEVHEVRFSSSRAMLGASG